MKNLNRLFCIFLLLAMLSSCASMFKAGAVVSAGASVLFALNGNEEAANLALSAAEASLSGAEAAEEITPEQQYYIGRAVAANIFQRYSLYSDKAAEQYLNQICGALIVNSPKPVLFKGYYVGILDTDEINAFATSGGHILVTKGLLRCTNSEDELAAVLAHEIGHIQLEHGISAIKANRITDAVKKFGSTALLAMQSIDDEDYSEAVEALEGSVGDIVSNMVDSGYSQTQEFDADKTALSLMAAAGYNPRAMEGMLNLINKNQKSSSGFGKTHPSPKDRLNKVNKLFKQYNVPDTSASRNARFTVAMKGIIG